MSTMGIANVKLALIDKKTNKVITGAEGINGNASDTTGIFKARDDG